MVAATQWLQFLVCCVGLVMLLGFGMFVLILMANGKIDLSTLLTESGGGASMSRFQLLIFTFVIAFSLFRIVCTKGAFPQIPTGVLLLLGISATTYGVSKGIQASGGLPSKGIQASGPGHPARVPRRQAQRAQEPSRRSKREEPHGNHSSETSAEVERRIQPPRSRHLRHWPSPLRPARSRRAAPRQRRARIPPLRPPLQTPRHSPAFARSPRRLVVRVQVQHRQLPGMRGGCSMPVRWGAEDLRVESGVRLRDE